NSFIPGLHSSASSGALLSSQCSSSPSIAYKPLRSSRPFSSTAAPQTRLREQMFEWLNSEGKELKSHTPGSPNYLTGLRERRQNNAQPGEPGGGVSRRPFPLNTQFVSESVLSEELRNEIHKMIMVENK